MSVIKKAMAAAAVAAAALALFTAPAAAATNDPYFSRLWGLHRTGAEPAWRAATGAGVAIAIIDSGVDPSHPDLQAKLLQGKDFFSNDDDPRDENGHGTLIAGIPAAVTGNSVGIASVAPQAKILPVRAFGPDGASNSRIAADSIRWSVDESARLGLKAVVNLSFEQEAGGTLALFDQQVDSAIKYAASRGAAVVIASGNAGAGETAYDSTVAGAVVVGATDRYDRRWGNSNYGRGLDLVAPGVEITSTYWNKGTSTYGVGEGTSIGVAFVSGAAAVLMSTGMNGADALSRLKETAQDLGTPGKDDQFGHGLLDVAKAMGVSREAAPVASPQAPRGTPRPAAAPRAVSPPATVSSPAAPADPSPAAVAPVASPSPLDPLPSPTAYLFEDASPSLFPRQVDPLRYLAAGMILMVISMHLVRRALLL